MLGHRIKQEVTGPLLLREYQGKNLSNPMSKLLQREIRTPETSACHSEEHGALPPPSGHTTSSHVLHKPYFNDAPTSTFQLKSVTRQQPFYQHS